jgi:hypothetical protein
LTKIFKKFQTLNFRTYDDYQDISGGLKKKYNESLELYEKMHSDFPHKRPNCEEILERKRLWALNDDEITDEQKIEIISKIIEGKKIFVVIFCSITNCIFIFLFSLRRKYSYGFIRKQKKIFY